MISMQHKFPEISGKIEARALATGHSPGMADAMVAGIAEAQGLVVITRNVKHFRALGISAVTPEEIVKER